MVIDSRNSIFVALRKGSFPKGHLCDKRAGCLNYSKSFCSKALVNIQVNYKNNKHVSNLNVKHSTDVSFAINYLE